MTNDNNYNSLDVLKLLLSILIIGIHIAPFTTISKQLSLLFSNGLCRIAVPLFLIISGFLFEMKITNLSDKKKYIKKYILKLVNLYLIWTIIYIPFIIIQMKNNEYPIYLDFLIFIRNFIFSGSYFHLWYIKDLILSIIMICFLRKFKLKNNNILFIFIIMYLIGMLFDSYNGIFLNIVHNQFIIHLMEIFIKLFSTTRNALFFGNLFVFIGMLQYSNSKSGGGKILNIILGFIYSRNINIVF